MSKKPTMKPGTPILVGIGVFVAIALVVALALAGSNVRTYASDTPEAVAQAYFQALFDEDTDAAYDYLSAGLKAECEPSDLDMWWIHDAQSVSFDGVRVTGNHAAIELRLLSTDFDMGIFPFEDYENSLESELELDRTHGEWKITDATWPLAGCTWR
jgi:hypothetical protein